MREYGDYIQDILDAISEARAFVHGMTYEEFKLDKKTINAVIRSVEVVGEAAKSVTSDLRARYSDVPWKRMAGMRDKLIHEYFGVDLEIVWEVIQSELPPLVPRLEEMLRQLDEEADSNGRIDDLVQ